MTLKEKVMDKYWLEFLASEKGDMSTSHHPEIAFWFWFYHTKMKGGAGIKLEEYLR